MCLWSKGWAHQKVAQPSPLAPLLWTYTLLYLLQFRVSRRRSFKHSSPRSNHCPEPTPCCSACVFSKCIGFAREPRIFAQAQRPKALFPTETTRYGHEVLGSRWRWVAQGISHLTQRTRIICILFCSLAGQQVPTVDIENQAQVRIADFATA